MNLPFRIRLGRQPIHFHDFVRLARLPGKDILDCTCGYRRIVNTATGEEVLITTPLPDRALIDVSQISR